jgi:ubiquinone/menaquinone biosynthesis C-methylase UbiE
MDVDTEVGFWERMLKGEYPQFQAEFMARFDPNVEVTGLHAAVLDDLSKDIPVHDIHILDLGAGLVTPIGRLYHGTRLGITAVDVRADYYNQLLSKYGKVPPIPTRFADACDLKQYFLEKSFHWIHVQNALDHMESPLACIKGMVHLLKSGGFISMGHQINEGRIQNYEGLHQFDCFKQGDSMYIKRRNGKKYNVSKTLRSLGSCEYIRVTVYGDGIELIAKLAK